MKQQPSGVCTLQRHRHAWAFDQSYQNFHRDLNVTWSKGSKLPSCKHRRLLIWPQGYKTFFMLNSAEREILNAQKYENIKKFSIFQA